MLTQRRSLFVMLVLAAAFLLAACQTDTSSQQLPAEDAPLPPPVVSEPAAVSEAAAVAQSGATIETGQNGPGSRPDTQPPAGAPNTADHVLLTEPLADLNQAEIDALIYMREEEKLARDVYLYLYDQWGQPIFQNIAASEQAHMDSVLGLLDLYAITDPAIDETGRFSNPELQALYDQLVAQGAVSAEEALMVGALIEEVDILDLQVRLAETTNAQIVQVFNNLLNGSSNHLRAFVTNLERLTGQSYQPQMMTLEAYQAIIDGTMQQGGGNGNGGGGRGNGGNGGGNRGDGNGAGQSAS